MCLTFLGQFENHCGGSNGTIHNLLEFQQLLALALKATTRSSEVGRTSDTLAQSLATALEAKVVGGFG